MATKIEHTPRDWTRIKKESLEGGWFEAPWFKTWFKLNRTKIKHTPQTWSRVTHGS